MQCAFILWKALRRSCLGKSSKCSSAGISDETLGYRSGATAEAEHSWTKGSIHGRACTGTCTYRNPCPIKSAPGVYVHSIKLIRLVPIFSCNLHAKYRSCMDSSHVRPGSKFIEISRDVSSHTSACMERMVSSLAMHRVHFLIAAGDDLWTPETPPRGSCTPIPFPQNKYCMSFIVSCGVVWSLKPVLTYSSGRVCQAATENIAEISRLLPVPESRTIVAANWAVGASQRDIGALHRSPQRRTATHNRNPTKLIVALVSIPFQAHALPLQYHNTRRQYLTRCYVLPLLTSLPPMLH